MLLKSILLFSLFYYGDSQSLPFGYHEKIGIPKATFMMVSEGGMSRIVGGTQVPSATVIPYQAGLVITLTTGWTSICGGALISSTRVLTAAHCWFDGQNQARLFTVVLGSTTLFIGGTRITTSDVVVHPSWNPNQITHDIAVVKISSVNFDNSIQAIPLPSIADVNQNFAGLTATASGFGKTSDAQNSFPATTSLQQVTLNIITNAVCQNSFDVAIHLSHLCTSGEGRVGTCDGDSGGPLVAVWNRIGILVGIVSFGLGDACQAGYPSVYTRVTAFLPWIQSHLQ